VVHALQVTHGLVHALQVTLSVLHERQMTIVFMHVRQLYQFYFGICVFNTLELKKSTFPILNL